MVMRMLGHWHSSISREIREGGAHGVWGRESKEEMREFERESEEEKQGERARGQSGQVRNLSAQISINAQATVHFLFSLG